MCAYSFFDMLGDYNRRESFYHAALINSKTVRPGTLAGEKALRAKLQEHGSFEEIYLSESGGLLVDDEISRDKSLVSLLKRIDKISFDFRVLTVNDVDFPQHLKDVEGSTPVLYTCGDVGLMDEQSISVVGTRKLEDRVDIEEGAAVVKRLVAKGYVVVSGLAAGCDTLGHTKAIEHGGKTIAVLGTPLDRFYPKENKMLQERIAAEHLVVSQYPIGVRTFPSYFAHRNLTTVSLSTEGVVVVRSGDKSGTQHAIRHCVAQEKPLYVMANNFGKGYAWVKERRQYLKVPNGR
ncbi:DNA-processing protein DprA [Nanoarchaeota archaeon]